MPPRSTLNVYRDWLGIEEAARPLNHYQLLRLKMFEDDASKYPQRYRRMTGHVRKVALADHPELAAKLIREIIDAMLCLSDARRKLEYDRKLGRPEDGQARRRTFEQALLGLQAVDPLELNKAKNFALAVGFELRDALIQRKLAPQEVIMSAYAESVGLPYLDPIDVEVDPALVEKVPDFLARKNSCVPMTTVDDECLVLSPFPIAPAVAGQLYEHTGMLVRTVLCAPHVIGTLVLKHYPRAMPTARRAPVATGSSGGGTATATLPRAASGVPDIRRAAAATALAEMKEAREQDDDDEPSPVVAAEDVATLESVRQMKLAVTLAAFGVTAIVYQLIYGIYAFVHFAPYSMKIFWLGWPLALLAAGIGWLASTILLSR